MSLLGVRQHGIGVIRLKKVRAFNCIMTESRNETGGREQEFIFKCNKGALSIKLNEVGYGFYNVLYLIIAQKAIACSNHRHGPFKAHNVTLSSLASRVIKYLSPRFCRRKKREKAIIEV